MWTLQDAKNKFSGVVDAALSAQPQQVSRRGRSAAVVIPVEEFARLSAAMARNRGSFLDRLLAFPGGIEDNDRPRAVPRDIAFGCIFATPASCRQAAGRIVH